jgi:NADH dehydrogenase
VVVVGGGFGGLSAALDLARGPEAPPVLLIEPQERFLFLPLLYECLSGELQRWEIAPRYSTLLAGSGVAWLQQRVQAINSSTRTLSTDDGRQLSYSQLVVATGGRSLSFGIPGVAEHSLGFRTLADVDRLQGLIERLVIVGAGASGVELACKLADLLDGAAVIELIEQGPDLLPGSKAFNRDQARSALLQRDVRLRCGTRVLALEASAIALEPAASPGGREQLGCEAVIWTGGVGGSVPQLTPELPLDSRGRLRVSPELQVIGAPGLFAIGDAARSTMASPEPGGDPDEGSLNPATAQVAYQQAQQVAANLRRLRRGEALEPFVWNDLGEMLGLGLGQATLTGMGMTLAGPAAYQLRRVAYLARMPGLQHQLKVAGGWLAAWL